jgi:formylglycine-generating enzyme required for sulfatase activity
MMTPTAKKLFISYRSLDSAKVDAIVSSLAALKKPDGTLLYTTWQDKKGIPPGKDWWEAIVDAIIDCEIFVFHISEEALKSDVCRAELQYARERNRFIIPVVLEGEFWIDPVTGKPNMAYWDQIPSALNDYRTQFLFYKGAAFFAEFEQAVAQYDPKRYRDIERPRPADPRGGSEVSHDSITLYDEACDYAGRLEFGTARKIFQKLIQRADNEFYAEAVEWTEIIGHYERLLAIDSRASTRFRVSGMWNEYKQRFPRPFIEGIFDPNGFGTRIDSKPRSADLLPAPFAWIEIPKKGYSITKYPVTNAQFAKFIDAGGYNQQKWWTAAGWDLRTKGWSWDGSKWVETNKPWIEPLYWRDGTWNGAEQPVVGVSWYEAVAFCLWLSDVTGERIMLPTKEQWQYAAQGADTRAYPWGEQWDSTRCNNNADKKGIGKTTPVQQYEDKGDSPFGVVDMAGNVWEWCLTDYHENTNNINEVAIYRILYGGSWDHPNSSFLRCDNYGGTKGDPNLRNYYWGFRLALS